MNTEDVPQDNSKTYYGHKRLLYAQDKGGDYTTVTSSGWEAEEQATLNAVNEFERLAEEARMSVQRGESSPLFYHMYARRMDLPLLAQTSGLFQWQVKRHFKPTVFSKLSEKKLDRYSEVLGVSVDALKTLP